ncbi:substance-K receptor [Nematostella vectensis]|uniref:substance-K receptor n=1 Tax=Nematostella vectensis TaxID=45351 RepID=UPI0020772E76|nr:substance-K receptor [Nematostella vectensis]XP_048586070.1 substance-K receptor [Nematostella vectensis]
MNITNQTNSSTLPSHIHPSYPRELRLFMRSVEGLTTIVGILCNVLVCVVILGRARKSAISHYLLSLATADLGILIFIVPVFIVRMEAVTWPFGEFGCVFMLPLAEMFYPASIWTITFIAVSRYISIVRRSHLRPRVRGTKSLKVTKATLAGIWLAAFLSGSLPMFFMFRLIKVRFKWFCSPQWPARNTIAYVRAYHLITSLIHYFIPLVIILATYCTIRNTLESSIDFHKKMHQGRKNEDSNTIALNIKSKRILTPLVLAFAILMLPVTLARLLQLFNVAIHYYLLSDIFLLCLATNSAIDPFIYYMVNSEFRTDLINMFKARPRLPSRASNISLTVTSLPRSGRTLSVCRNTSDGNVRNEPRDLQEIDFAVFPYTRTNSDAGLTFQARGRGEVDLCGIIQREGRDTNCNWDIQSDSSSGIKDPTEGCSVICENRNAIE